VSVDGVGGAQGVPVGGNDVQIDQQNQQWADEFNSDSQGTDYSVDYDDTTNLFTFALPDGTKTDPLSREDAETFAKNPALIFGMTDLSTSLNRDPNAVNAWIDLFESEYPGHTASYDVDTDVWTFDIDETKPDAFDIIGQLDFLKQMLSMAIQFAH